MEQELVRVGDACPYGYRVGTEFFRKNQDKQYSKVWIGNSLYISIRENSYRAITGTWFTVSEITV